MDSHLNINSPSIAVMFKTSSKQPTFDKSEGVSTFILENVKYLRYYEELKLDKSKSTSNQQVIP